MSQQNTALTDKEKQSIKVLNYVAKYDGIIRDEKEIKFILQQGIDKFVAKKRAHLVRIANTTYPIRIELNKK